MFVHFLFFQEHDAEPRKPRIEDRDDTLDETLDQTEATWLNVKAGSNADTLVKKTTGYTSNISRLTSENLSDDSPQKEARLVPAENRKEQSPAFGQNDVLISSNEVEIGEETNEDIGTMYELTSDNLSEDGIEKRVKDTTDPSATKLVSIHGQDAKISDLMNGSDPTPPDFIVVVETNQDGKILNVEVEKGLESFETDVTLAPDGCKTRPHSENEGSFDDEDVPAENSKEQGPTFGQNDVIVSSNEAEIGKETNEDIGTMYELTSDNLSYDGYAEISNPINGSDLAAQDVMAVVEVNQDGKKFQVEVEKGLESFETDEALAPDGCKTRPHSENEGSFDDEDVPTENLVEDQDPAQNDAIASFNDVQTVREMYVGKHDYNKTHACYFCGKLDLKMIRHLQTKHKQEPDVARIPAMDKSNHEKQNLRKRAIDKIRNVGDFNHNVAQLQLKKSGQPFSQLIVARRSKEGQHDSEDYVPCKYCLRFFVKGELWKHVVSCNFRQDNIDESYQGKDIIKAGKLLLYGAMQNTMSGELVDEFYRYIILSMQNDEVTRRAQQDQSIVSLGKTMFEKLGLARASDVRYKMRLMSRLKMEIVKSVMPAQNDSLSDYIKPQNFNKILEATRVLCGKSDEKTLNGVNKIDKPEVAKKIGHMLKKVSALKIGASIRERDSTMRKDAEDFMVLFNMEWTDKISSAAFQTSKERNFNKKEILPVTADLVKFQKYLSNEVPRALIELEETKSYQAWQKLAHLVMTKMQAFNFRRGNECSRMLVETYQNRASWKTGNEELANSLDKLESHLLQKLVSYFRTIEELESESKLRCFCHFQ